MKQTAVVVLMLMVAACGPDPDEIIRLENKKLTDLEPVEAVKVDEAMNRIRYESEIIAKGGVLPASIDSIDANPRVTETPVNADVQAPTPVPAPAPVSTLAPANPPSGQNSIPHEVQLGAFTTAEASKRAVAMWENRGFPNVVDLVNPDATTGYRFVVRLTGFQGYSTAFSESQRINSQFGIRSYPIQIRQ